MASRQARRRIALVVAWLCGGCALQLAPALHLPAHGRYRPSMELGVRYKPARRHGMYGALDATFADATRAATFGLREVALGAGYHLGLGLSALELGPRLGVGQPAFVALRGTGFHSALELAALFRVAGQDEKRVGFAPFAVNADLLVFARGGVWAHPQTEGGDPIWDAAFGLGLRFGLASDLSGSDRQWEAP